MSQPIYRLINDATGVPAAVELNARLSIPFDPANTDYQAYLKWLEEGNEPLPPDEVRDA